MHGQQNVKISNL